MVDGYYGSCGIIVVRCVVMGFSIEFVCVIILNYNMGDDCV